MSKLTKTDYTVFQNKQSGNIVKAWIDGVPLEEGAKQQLINVAALPFIHKHVAVMPDCHWGMGATVGSVIPTKGAIIPAAVGVDLGCFTGDTEIPLADGENHRLDELSKSDEKFVVWAYDVKTQKVVGAWATAKKTRSNAPLLAVVLDNGQTIRCTSDHRFLMRDGTYLEAEKIEIGSSLMPFGINRDKENYAVIYQPKTRSMQRAHWILARSDILGPIPSFEGQKTVIHHKDFCEWNNTPSNLEFMGNKDHSRYHRSLVERNEYWQSPEFEEKRKAAIATKAATPEGHAHYAALGTKNILKYMEENPKHYKQSVVDNGQRGKEYLVGYNKSEKGRAKSKEHANTVYPCEVCGKEIKSPIGYFAGYLPACKRKHGIDPGNHRVVDIISLDAVEDVYCLNVPKYHNFALTAGVFVHNCGMMAVKTSLSASDLPDNLKAMRSSIERAVPHGRTDNGGRNDRGAWGDVPRSIAVEWDRIKNAYKLITDKHPEVGGRKGNGKTAEHLGSLGSGNHFIEVCLDQNNDVWIMLHSGSRGVGNRIGSHFIKLAQKDMEKWFINWLPDKNLSYFPEGTDHFSDYTFAVKWAQDFARLNREIMMENVIAAILKSDVPGFNTDGQIVNCHHNYVDMENHYNENVWVTRKGAVSAKKGEWGIIPGSMGAKSFIVVGKGNPESFNSCSHGAGRVMSRTEAKKTFSIDQHKKATEGVECRKDAGVIDETPKAYKDIDAVMHAQKDLVDIRFTLKQVLCVKG